MMDHRFPDEIVSQHEIDAQQRVPYGDHVGRCSQDLWEEYHGSEAESFWGMVPWLITGGAVVLTLACAWYVKSLVASMPSGAW